MKHVKAGVALTALIAVVLAIPAVVGAQNLPCNMDTPPCSGSLPCNWSACDPALGGCPAGSPLLHSSLGECTAGAGNFDLRGTQYENTCAGFGTCTVGQPPLRFWGFNGYLSENYGCGWPGPSGGEWMINLVLDFGMGTNAGHWYLYQANWQSCATQGCPNGTSGRTVAEISDVCEAGSTVCAAGHVEGTALHSSWYLLASVPFVGGSYEFDSITGADGAGGCGPADVAPLEVAGLQLPGKTSDAACTNMTAIDGTANAVNASYGDVDVTLVPPAAGVHYFTEAGMDDPAVQLIAGHQVVYYNGASAPTTSDPAMWMPVHDTANPTQGRDFFPVGTLTGTVTVPQPAAGQFTWLATRIVYADSSINPAGTFDPTTAAQPQLTSMTGTHCGPVQFGTGPVAVTWNGIEAQRVPQGVRINWSTSYESDVSGYKVIRRDAFGIETPASSMVRAQGPSTYEYLDTAVAGDRNTYTYYVQEYTFTNGAESTSPEVTVGPATSTGGRSRGGLVR